MLPALVVSLCIGAQGMARPLELGVDRFLRLYADSLAGKRIAVLTHAAARTSSGELSAQALRSRFHVVAFWAPEHGFRGAAPAGAPVPDTTFEGVPVYSLYGPRRRPPEQWFDSIDAVVVDLQDAGFRAYTYISTLYWVLDACAAAGKPVYVLDRPNPLGGVMVEGAVLDTALRSFVGIAPIPYVHGCTIGELAQLFVAEGWLPRAPEWSPAPSPADRCPNAGLASQHALGGYRAALDPTFRQTSPHRWLPAQRSSPASWGSWDSTASASVPTLHSNTSGHRSFRQNRSLRHSNALQPWGSRSALRSSSPQEGDSPGSAAGGYSSSPPPRGLGCSLHFWSWRNSSIACAPIGAAASPLRLARCCPKCWGSGSSSRTSATALRWNAGTCTAWRSFSPSGSVSCSIRRNRGKRANFVPIGCTSTHILYNARDTTMPSPKLALVEELLAAEAEALRKEKSGSDAVIEDFGPGDLVDVGIRVIEGDKERIQHFQGIVLYKRGQGPSTTFCVRKISHGVGVERIFPLYSPMIESVRVLRRGRVRRARIYFIRQMSEKRIRQKLRYSS
jgi:ribosomal protein L19